MVAFERCDAALCHSLRRYEANIDLGLHLCLTDEGLKREATLAPASRNLRFLLNRVLLPGASSADIAREISLQFGLFAEKFGRLPDYIDGHLHVHQLPGIRSGLLEFIATLPAAERPYVRNTSSRTGQLISVGLPWGKAKLIGHFGTAMKNLLAAADIPTNSGFYGIYDFAKSPKFPTYFPRFVKLADDANSILVVHPGKDEAWRRQEWETLRRFKPEPGQINRFQRA